MVARIFVLAWLALTFIAHAAAAQDDRFAGAVNAAGDLPRLHSLLASWRGEVVLERYFNGARATRAANVKSVSKSIISALVGVAIDRGMVRGPETPIRTYFPEIAKDKDARKQRITIEDLLTMRSGLESTSNRNYGAWVQSRNWVQHALAKPLFAEPGTQMEYSTGNTHLLSAILTKATGASTWQFAQDSLAKPLGFTLPRWPQDPQGIYFGGNDMLLTPRQMLSFGELYLRHGRQSVKGSDPVTDLQMGPDESRRVEGVVVAQLPSGLYHVQVEGEHRVTAHQTGSIERNFVRLLVGDRVIVELTERDGTRGRIVRKT